VRWRTCAGPLAFRAGIEEAAKKMLAAVASIGRGGKTFTFQYISQSNELHIAE
jgi:hypothetical protein